jgi:hypothetical protein
VATSRDALAELASVPATSAAAIVSTNRFARATEHHACLGQRFMLPPGPVCEFHHGKKIPMLGAMFELAQPLLYALDPEQAHELTLEGCVNDTFEQCEPSY